MREKNKKVTNKVEDKVENKTDLSVPTETTVDEDTSAVTEVVENPYENMSQKELFYHQVVKYLKDFGYKCTVYPFSEDNYVLLRIDNTVPIFLIYPSENVLNDRIEGFNKAKVISARTMTEFLNEFENIESLSYNEYCTYVFNWCKRNVFLYPSYSENSIRFDHEKLINSPVDTYDENNIYGVKSIYNFIHYIWKCNKASKLRPEDIFLYDKLLIDCIARGYIYKTIPEDYLNLFKIINHINVSPTVDIIPPYIYKYLVNKYLAEYDMIFDPYSIFGSSTVGIASLNKKSTAQTPYKDMVPEVQNLMNDLSILGRFYEADMVPSAVIKHDCLICCPPDGAKEMYNKPILQKSSDDWICTFLTKYSCYKYVFFVKNTQKYYNNVKEIITINGEKYKVIVLRGNR